MNTNYYQNNMPNMEESYIENILRLNKGKKVKLYYTYPDSINNRDMVYEGIIEQAGIDHIIIHDFSNNKSYLLLMLYLNYVEFSDEINYNPNYYPKN